jgi:hypothetical protein
MRAILCAGLALAAVTRGAAGQDEAALRAAFEGKIVTARIDMPATSEGVDVYPFDATPVDFRAVARRMKEYGTAVKVGQQVMITKVLVKKDSHIEFQLGAGGYGTFGDMLSEDSDVRSVSVGETREERILRETIDRTSDRDQRKRLQRELDALRTARERENARAAADARQANLSHQTMVRSKRLESGSRFNIRYRNGIPPEGRTPESVRLVLAQYLDFPGSPAGIADGGISALRKGLTVVEVEALLGPAATAADEKDGSMTVTKRTYRREGKQVVASFVSGVLVDFAITPQ